jgi:hypothetical protein
MLGMKIKYSKRTGRVRGNVEIIDKIVKKDFTGRGIFE